jgi:hypothetical protein
VPQHTASVEADCVLDAVAGPQQPDVAVRVAVFGVVSSLMTVLSRRGVSVGVPVAVSTDVESGFEPDT